MPPPHMHTLFVELVQVQPGSDGGPCSNGSITAPVHRNQMVNHHPPPTRSQLGKGSSMASFSATHPQPFVGASHPQAMPCVPAAQPGVCIQHVDRGLGFHMFCLDPPLDSIPKDQWFCFTCLSRTGGDFGFDEGEEHSLSSFQAVTKSFVACGSSHILLSMPKSCPMPETIRKLVSVMSPFQNMMSKKNFGAL